GEELGVTGVRRDPSLDVGGLVLVALAGEIAREQGPIGAGIHSGFGGQCLDVLHSEVVTTKRRRTLTGTPPRTRGGWAGELVVYGWKDPKRPAPAASSSARPMWRATLVRSNLRA